VIGRVVEGVKRKSEGVERKSGSVEGKLMKKNNFADIIVREICDKGC
jgi:hypothetical protein